MSSSSDPVFLTETKIAIDEFPAEEVEHLQALVSGVDQVSQSTMLLKKRKEMREVDDALDFMKEEYAHRMEACDERQREFERKQQEMREQVARFEKFIRENDAKRQRAEAKEKAERRSCQLNEAKKVQLASQLADDIAAKAALESKVEKLVKYRTYMERVVDGCGEEYDEINDILNRHATLVDANNDLRNQVNAVESEIDQLRVTHRSLTREAQNTILVENSEIHRLQQQLESHRGRNMALSVRRERDDQVCNDRSRESGQIILSIKNLYQRCCVSMPGRHRVVKESNDKSELVFLLEVLKILSERMLDLDYIVSNFNKADYEGSNTTEYTTLPSIFSKK